ncbi:hypothetical protein B0H13DRAFT_2385087 [Mycena leptocephala]|nr:hypothetical protein B0H13DRAFT_2385087 [Mycena leptocephala]
MTLCHPSPEQMVEIVQDIHVIVEFISQHEYKDLMFGIVNEAYLPGIGRYVLTSL